jgi:hypothetical protein
MYNFFGDYICLELLVSTGEWERAAHLSMHAQHTISRESMQRLGRETPAHQGAGTCVTCIPQQRDDSNNFLLLYSTSTKSMVLFCCVDKCFCVVQQHEIICKGVNLDDGKNCCR